MANEDSKNIIIKETGLSFEEYIEKTEISVFSR